jgi:hypothetical protein
VGIGFSLWTPVRSSQDRVEPEAGGQACVFRRAGLVLGEPGEDLIENSNPGDYPSPGNELPKMAGPPSCDVLRGFKHTHTHTHSLAHSLSLSLEHVPRLIPLGSCP